MSKLTKSLWLILMGTLTLSLITSCSSINPPAQPQQEQSVNLEPSTSIGQTFVADFDGLESIDIFFSNIGTTGLINLALYEDPSKTSAPLGNASIDLAVNNGSGFHRFTLPVQVNSTNEYFYIEITQENANSTKIGNGNGDTYLNGSLYSNNEPVDGQISFQLNYNLLFLVKGLFEESFNWMGLFLTSIFLFLLPGWALSDLLLEGWKSQSIWVKVPISIGVSLSVYPLMILWTSLFGISLGTIYAFLPGTIAIIYLSWKIFPEFNNYLRKNNQDRISLISILSKLGQVKLIDWVMIIFLIVITFTRFFVIRNLEVPMWGDSYQHTMITQLISDNKGLFDSWLPYAELSSFTYHFGFHSLASVLNWITGLDSAKSVLWSGQLLNIFAVLSIAPLAMRIGRGKLAAASAILFAGLLVPMPMTYVNWGRYTQLAALVILPIAVWILWFLFDNRSLGIRGYLLAWLLLSGLALTHYRILLFALLFFPAFIIIFGSRLGYKKLINQMIVIGVGAGILFLPWFIHIFGGKIFAIFNNQITTPGNQTGSIAQQTNEIGNLLVFLPLIVWLLLPVIVIWRLWRRDRGIALLIIWWALILIASNPQWLGLPGAGIISNFAVFISIYIPASLILGMGVRWAGDKLKHLSKHTPIRFTHSKFKLYASFITIIFVLVFTLWAGAERLRDVQPYQYVLVTRPDRRAFDWIKSNSTNDTKFLVNSFPAFGGSVVAGSDGGWWIPLLGNRGTNLPPLSYGLEADPWPGYQEWVNALTKQLISKGPDDPEVLTMLSDRKISKVYIGQRRGLVGYSGPQILEVDTLLDSDHYKPIYHEDRVWIFDIINDQ